MILSGTHGFFMDKEHFVFYPSIADPQSIWQTWPLPLMQNGWCRTGPLFIILSD